MNGQPKETPEETGQRIMDYFLTDYIPGVITEYEYLKTCTDKCVAMSFADFQTEMLILGLHCLDRATFAHHGAEYRNKFMDGAFSLVRVALAGSMPEVRRGAFLIRLDKLYNLRQREYGTWKLTKGDSPKGTLFWEFGKQICEYAKVYNPVAIFMLSESAFGIFEMMNEVVEKAIP